MTDIRLATLADLSYIEHLRRQESDAIGFIPIQRYEMEIDGRRHGTMLLAFENDDPVGFIYATHNRAGVTHIQQVAVQEDAGTGEAPSGWRNERTGLVGFLSLCGRLREH